MGIWQVPLCVGLYRSYLTVMVEAVVGVVIAE